MPRAPPCSPVLRQAACVHGILLSVGEQSAGCFVPAFSEAPCALTGCLSQLHYGIAATPRISYPCRALFPEALSLVFVVLVAPPEDPGDETDQDERDRDTEI